MSLTVIPLRSRRQRGGFDVYVALHSALKEGGVTPRTGDVIVVSTKLVSNAQGRVLRCRNVRATDRGRALAGRFKMRPDVAEIILRESDEVFGGIAGFVITMSGDIMAPNAGIDRSNAGAGSVILYPNEPCLVAEQLCRKVFLGFGVHVGVILADSRLMPGRVGTSGVAVACAGMEPVLDMRASSDLEGNPLKVTFQAVADNIASIANHKMGEGSESTPFAVVRDSGAVMTGRRIAASESAVPAEQCLYVRGLSSDASAP